MNVAYSFSFVDDQFRRLAAIRSHVAPTSYV
jgi:hypothetical protein